MVLLGRRNGDMNTVDSEIMPIVRPMSYTVLGELNVACSDLAHDSTEGHTIDNIF